LIIAKGTAVMSRSGGFSTGFGPACRLPVRSAEGTQSGEAVFLASGFATGVAFEWLSSVNLSREALIAGDGDIKSVVL